jgi:hypothetical protein
MNPAQYQRRRFLAESQLEHAIDILNELDADADLEDGADDEPTLGSAAGGDSQLCWSTGCEDDREADAQLASLERTLGQKSVAVCYP